MPLPPKKDHRITLPEAADMTRGHRNADPGQPKAHLFHREALDTILAQPGCAAIRIYRARDKGGMHNVVLVGVNEAGADMTDGAVMERCSPCPPDCDSSSALAR